MVIGALLLPLVATASPSSPTRPPVPPRPTPRAFSTSRYGLTFRTPRGATFCPLPRDWTGSDHGTTIFLVPPRRCAGDAGFASTGRGFDPAAAPRIEVFYAYDAGDDAPTSPCRRSVSALLLGRPATLCRGTARTPVTWTTTKAYAVGPRVRANVSMTLVTTRDRERPDLAVFRRLLATVATCSDERHPEHGAGQPAGERFATGVGPRCPADARFF